ncbi:MAG: hypothetical protein KVP17_002439 [Porospora cf. gigantea B]|uniref:uncharacterized protein n=1 Tax=Porospora cf. gigantea B TaxID=2853592 RepID=UPI003571831A|nr:MAG: hypothetical protein KVP17_002439 [Porospora cf. gigantea B]
MEEARHKVTFEGRELYEWSQTLEDVTFYTLMPCNISKANLDVAITSSSVRLGLKGAAPFLEDKWWALVCKDETYWTLTGRELQIHATKARPGATWAALLKSHETVDASADRQRLLLERFHREHPGFDFSQASVNGNVPDARDFMGGLDVDKLRR